MHAKIVICQFFFFSEERISASLGINLVDRVKNDARVDGQGRVLLNSLLLVHSDRCFALSCKTVILRRFHSLIDVFCAYVESLAGQLYVQICMQITPKGFLLLPIELVNVLTLGFGTVLRGACQQFGWVFELLAF